MQVEFPHNGMETWVNPHGIRVLRLHYSADEHKDAAWVEREKPTYTNPAIWEQEQEINFSALLGTLLYQIRDEATLENSFPIPENWTRYWALDPHPRVPHAILWCAVDPFGDMWAYRELWPSKAYGKAGAIPEDDNRIRVRDYVQTIQWLESTDNPENSHLKHPEKIFRQIVDYAIRGFKGTSDDIDQRNFQERYEEAARSLNYPLFFQDAVKHDESASIEIVNDWLKPRDVEQADGTFKPKSKLHIFQDKCPELIHELHTNRYPTLSPLLAERQDPVAKPLQLRKHVSDCLKYICRANPEFVGVRQIRSTRPPTINGIAY